MVDANPSGPKVLKFLIKAATGKRRAEAARAQLLRAGRRLFTVILSNRFVARRFDVERCAYC